MRDPNENADCVLDFGAAHQRQEVASQMMRDRSDEPHITS